MSRPSTEATTSVLPAGPGLKKLGIYKTTNAKITMARLHLSQPLCRRIRSSMVMGSAASFGDVENDNYATLGWVRASGCGIRDGGSERPSDPGCRVSNS